MEISVTITKVDLAALNWHMLPRVRGNWIFAAIIAFGVSVYLWVSKQPESIEQYALVAVASIVGGLGGVLAGFLINTTSMLFTMGKNDGVLGSHSYRLTPDGLEEHTAVNETTQRWAGVEEISQSGRFILFRVNGYLFHIVPRRAFESKDAYDTFYEQAKAFRAAA